MKRVCRGGKGPQLEGDAEATKDEGLVMNLATHQVFRSCRQRCTTKRRNRQPFASTPSMTRCTERMSWHSPTNAAKPTAGSGSDGQTFEVIEAYGVERWLDELAQELKAEPIDLFRAAVYIPNQTEAAAVRVPASGTEWRKWRQF